MTLRHVLVSYHHLPHYRYGVFHELDSSDEFVFTFAGGTASRDGSIPSIPPKRLRRVFPLTNRWLGPALWQSGLLGLIIRGRFDAAILLGDAAHITTWIVALVLRVQRKPVAFWTIGWHRPDKGWKRLLRTAFYRLANDLLVYGEDGQRYGRESGYPARRMHVIGNSYESVVDRPKTTSASRSLTLARQAKLEGGLAYVGTIARLTPEKRFDLLIAAAAEARRMQSPIAVLLGGEGPERERLERQAQDLGVPLFLIGSLYGESEIEDFYALLDVTVLPERAGLSTIQSMRYGRPVVTVDEPERQVPEYRAVVPGVTGSLYKAGDATSLAEEVRFWIKCVRFNPEEVRRQCVIEYLRHWSPHVNASRVQAYLRSLKM